MLKKLQSEVSEIRELVKTPTPENFQAANSKLESIAASLNGLSAESCRKVLSQPDTREFLRRLPAEMDRLRVLMEAPSIFYQGLENLRAAHFGAYERSGNLRSLETRSLARTVVHL